MNKDLLTSLSKNTAKLSQIANMAGAGFTFISLLSNMMADSAAPTEASVKGAAANAKAAKKAAKAEAKAAKKLAKNDAKTAKKLAK